jgi:uncharacterized membrane protein SirB2
MPFDPFLVAINHPIGEILLAFIRYMVNDLLLVSGIVLLLEVQFVSFSR